MASKSGHKKSGQGDFRLASRTLAAVLVAKELYHSFAGKHKEKTVDGLIFKVILEDIPRHGPELADESCCVGKEIKEATVKELAEFYPPAPDGTRSI